MTGDPFFVHNRWIAIALSIFLLLVGGIIFSQRGSEFTPRLREGCLLIRYTMGPSISLEESKRTIMIIERRLMNIPAIAGTVTRVGRGEVGAHSELVNKPEMFVIFKPKDKWRSSIRTQEQLEDLVRKELGDIPGVLSNLFQPIEATVDGLVEGVKAELAIKLFGDDLDILKQKADEIAATIGTVRGAVDIQVDQVTGTPQLLIRPDRQAIARYGLNLFDVQEVIRTAVRGVTAGQIFEGIHRFDILVRFVPDARSTIKAIKSIPIETPDGKRVPLSMLAKIQEIVGPRQITRENNQRFITVQCNVTGRDTGSFVKEAQKLINDQVELPPVRWLPGADNSGCNKKLINDWL